MTQLPEHHDDVGPGWTPILERLHAGLITIVPDYQVTQVKEKFGGLRVYLVHEPAPVEELVLKAMHDAETTCEECGTQDQVTTEGRGWIKTLCPPCRTARSARLGNW